MISVLIPVYNYNANSLIIKIHVQLLESTIPFEIIVLDDNSDPEFIGLYQELKGLSYTQIIYSENNRGIIGARKRLSEQSRYDWLLFLDADVEIVSETFISNYLSLVNKKFEALFGGYTYNYPLPDPNYSLRYYYGKSKEAKTATYRNTKPYKFVISGNFLIKKSTYLGFMDNLEGLGYGSDTCLGILLKMQRTSIYHIDNPVNHRGLDGNVEYLGKMERAAETLLAFANNYKVPDNGNDLLNLYLKLKSIHLVKIFARFFSLTKKRIRKDLLSDKPNINALQLYRLGYICYYSIKTSTI